MIYHRSKITGIIVCITIIALAMVFLSACSTIKRQNGREKYQYKNRDDTEFQAKHARINTETGSLAEMIERINPSVVGISTLHRERGFLNEEVYTFEGIGSGFIVHESGYILTNDHVAGGADKITVVLHNGDELNGRVLWSDPTLDLAVVKVNAAGLPYAEMGDSENLMVGDTAVAIGTPLGLQFQHTVTAGIISALNRTVRVPTDRGENYMEDLIQTDASINPGNSGGPLLNARGEVVGINTVKVASAEGIGFAIPIDVAKPIIKRFVEEGEFVTPYIGIVGFDKEMASYLKRDGSIEEGVYIVNIDPKGPAYKSGIRIDDIITEINGQKVTTMLDLRKALYNFHVDDSIKVTIFRRGSRHTFDVGLAKKSERAVS